jgi:hypothetical protein
MQRLINAIVFTVLLSTALISPASAQITKYTEELTPANDDLFYLVKAGGAPGSDRKLKYGNILNNLPAASATVSGIVTTGVQTFAGVKTFQAGLISSSNISVTGNITATGNIAATGISATGNLSAGGTLGITGTTTLGVLSSGNTTIGGTLGVTGNTTIGGTLGVTGATTFSNNLTTNTSSLIGFGVSPVAGSQIYQLVPNSIVGHRMDLGVTPGDALHINSNGSTGGNLFKVDSSGNSYVAGNIGISETNPGARLQANTGSAATKGLIVKGAAVQTANLQEWQNSAGTNLASVSSAGRLFAFTEDDPANPAYSFTSSSNSGMYFGGNRLNFSSSGTHILALGSSGLRTIGAGSASEAIISRQGSDTTGIFWPSNAIGFTINGSEVARFASTGNVGIGETNPGARLQTNADVSTTKVLIVKGAVSQTANLTEWQNSTGTVLSSVSSGGRLFAFTENDPANPAYSFTSSTGSGMYFGGNRLNFSMNGNQALELGSSGLRTIGTGSASDAIIARQGDDNTGLFWLASGDVVGITAGGTETARFVSTGLSIGSGTPINKVLSATGILDFASTAADAVADLTVTVTGAAVGDVVDLGIPHGSTTATSTFSGWVSAADTVTVRFSHSAAGAEDPASGTFRVMVTKF